MKFNRFTFRYYKNWWTLIPTIEIHGTEPVFYGKNFSIQIHFLCFHWRWLFLKEDDNE